MDSVAQRAPDRPIYARPHLWEHTAQDAAAEQHNTDLLLPEPRRGGSAVSR